MARIYPDTDEVNESFATPFSGMKEMYALQKGIEAGYDAGLDTFKETILKLGSDYTALESELQAAKKENEELMKADYWQDRHNIVMKENQALKQSLRAAYESLQQIRDTPGLGGLDFTSTKKWRESSMKIINNIATETLTAILDEWSFLKEEK